MHIKNLFSLPVFILFAIISGNTYAESTPASQNNDGNILSPLPTMASLFIYRDAAPGSENTIVVSINGKVLGNPSPMSYIRADVKPGLYKLSTSTASNLSNVYINAQANNNYYVRQEVKTEDQLVRSFLSISSKEEGITTVSSAKLLAHVSDDYLNSPASIVAQDYYVNPDMQRDADGHFYAVIESGRGIAADVCADLTAPTGCSSATSIFGIGVGYQYAPQFALELRYIGSGDLTGSGTTQVTTPSGNTNSTISQRFTGMNMSAVMAAPLNKTFSLIGKAGILYSRVQRTTNLDPFGAFSGSSDSTSHNNLTFPYGVGVGININDNLALRVLYESLGSLKASSDGAGRDLTMYSGGLVVGF